jgi:hypothetical protein
VDLGFLAMVFLCGENQMPLSRMKMEMMR